MQPERRRHVDAMFRARVSWIVIGAVGMMGLVREGPIAVRAGLLLAAITAFGWLNRMQVEWAGDLRQAADPRWKPMAIGLALRCVGLALALAVGW